MNHSTSPTSNGTWYDENFTTVNMNADEIPGAEITQMQLCHGFLGAVGFLENLGVLLVVLKNRIVLDCPGNWFVLNLVISDALMCVAINILVNVFLYLGQKVEILISLIRFIILLNIGNLFMLTFNRFLSLRNSLRYPALMTVTRAKCLALVPWIIAFFLCVFYKCFRKAYVGNTYYGALILSITVLNIYIFKQAIEKNREIRRLEHAVRAPKTALRENGLAIRLLFIFLTFFGSCIPLMVFGGKYESDESPSSPSFIASFIWYAVALQINAIVDPIVYSINHPIFTRYLEQIRKLLRQRNAVVPDGQNNWTFETENGKSTTMPWSNRARKVVTNI